MTRSVHPASLDGRRRQRRHRLGRVPPRVLGSVLDLDVDDHAVADGQDIGQERHMGRQVGHAQRGDGAEPGDLGVVVHGQGPVGGEPHVQLDPVGPQAPRLGEGVQRVLGEPLGATPVRIHRRHRSPPNHRSRMQRVRAAEFCTKTPCQALGGPLPSSR